jgi:hypothetical protein
MSTQSRPPRAYSFPPLFRGASSSQQMRVSDAERQAVVDQLAEHFADGRLDHAEFDERVGRAMSAKTREDLTGLFTDLPDNRTEVAPAAQVGSPVARRGQPRPVLLLALVVVVALAAAHTVLFAGLWLFAFLAVVLLVATRGVRHARPRQDH